MTPPCTIDGWEVLNMPNKTCTHWKYNESKAHADFALCRIAAGDGERFGSTNVSHQAYPLHLPDSGPAEVALLSQLDNVIENPASAAANNKSVLKQIVTNNTKLTNRNAILAATNTQLVGKVKALRYQEKSSNNTGGKGCYRGLEKCGYCSFHVYKVSKDHNIKMCNRHSTNYNESFTHSDPMSGSTANKVWDR